MRKLVTPVFRAAILVIIGLTLRVDASETDWFSPRYQNTPDALPLINQEINRRAKKAIEKLNRNSTPLITHKPLSILVPNGQCNWNQLDRLLGEELRRPILGQLEAYIIESPEVPKIKLTVDDSIYRSFSLTDYLPIKLGTLMKIGFASHISHRGFIVGSDKFGHFLDEGYYYYYLVHELNRSLDQALRFGDFTENAYNGRWSSGIISYADLAANLEGYYFWKNALGIPKNRSDSKYFQCSQGKWEVKQLIDLNDYANAAWDEGMNCNAFRSRSMNVTVTQIAQNLEQKTGRRYQCPSEPHLVPGMIQRYGERAKFVIHPSLF